MRHLEEFQAPSPGSIFAQANDLPQFFRTNLLDPARRVKVFRQDPNSNIRVFYYSYLKLCFEVEGLDYEQYVKKIQSIINNQNFNILFEEENEVYNDLQFKTLIMEFFGLIGDNSLNVENAIESYPVMDVVFIHFFRSVLILNNVVEDLSSYVDRSEVFNALTAFFEVEMNIHGNCIHFPQTDVFVYEEVPEEVFMAYMSNEQETDTNIQQPIVAPTIKVEKVVIQQSPISLIEAKPQSNVSHKSKSSQINGSYIQGQFLDYTSNGPALHTLVPPNKLKSSGTIDEQNSNKFITNSDYLKKDDYHSYKAPQYKSKVEEITKKNEVPSFITAKNEYANDYKIKIPYDIPTSSLKKTDESQVKLESAYNPSNIYGDFKPTVPKPWQPTKDYDFGAKTTTSVFNQSNTFSNSQGLNNYSNQDTFQSYANPVISPKTDYGASSSYLNSGSSAYTFPKQPISNSYVPTPINSTPFYKPQTKIPTYNPIPSYQVKKNPSYDTFVAPTSQYSSTSTTKNIFGLNVSNQFTNSFTMKLMNQPHRSNVQDIKIKARNYRNSLQKFIK